MQASPLAFPAHPPPRPTVYADFCVNCEKLLDFPQSLSKDSASELFCNFVKTIGGFLWLVV